ncbi:hypothetical protein ODJ79_09795 [Actinoplanes sp. KI2]|nr:hypothetical protein [Actinoplanes sp. KI2]MCU7724007.1 hypothetical protein [Actinoplanes sp. KI2]
MSTMLACPSWSGPADHQVVGALAAQVGAKHGDGAPVERDGAAAGR